MMRFTGQVAGQVTGQAEAWITKVLEACATPLKSSEIKDVIGIRHRETFQRNYLDRLLAEGWLERTTPDKPRRAFAEMPPDRKGESITLLQRPTGYENRMA